MKIKKIIWLSLILVLSIGGCQIFSPPNVETIVTADYLRYWYLSPNGDYLLYSTSDEGGDFLLNLATGQKHEIECTLHWWDNDHIGCYDYDPFGVFVIDVETLVRTPLTAIDLTKKVQVDKPEYANELFIKQLLVNAELIYRPEWLTNTVYILAPDYQLNPDENYVVLGLAQPDELLAKHTVTNVPRDLPGDRSNEKTYSPDGLYYYDVIIDGFAIFSTDNNQIVSKYVEEELWMLDILGWVPDSSGVYFVTERVGLTVVGPEAVRKLKIPNK